jgi:hypothetical protein
MECIPDESSRVDAASHDLAIDGRLRQPPCGGLRFKTL